jgi:putative transposase
MEPGAPHRKKNKKYNIEGHAHFLTFSCYRRLPLLTNDRWREWLAESTRAACRKHLFALWAYVFMPEHVHLLLKPRRPVYDVAVFEHDLKLVVARRILSHLKNANSTLLTNLRVEASGQQTFRFWQAGGGHDLNVWTLKKAVEKAQYCHRNPVKRRLVTDPVQWRWSSYRCLELGKSEDEPLIVDDWDETLIGE